MANQVFNQSEIYNLKQAVSYSDGSIVSKIIRKSEAGNLTLFAFDKGQNLSEHTAPYDAVVQVIEGRAKVIIDGREFIVNEGDFIVMPAHSPHALEAPEKFKMFLAMIKG